jgi:hypothetical protein
MIVLSTLALSLALARCSPLSVSQSRQQTVRGNGGGSAADPNSVTPIDEAQAQVRAITSTPATVRDESDTVFKAEIAALPEHQRIVVSADGDKEAKDAVDSFRANRTIILELRNFALDECKAYLGVSLRNADIASYGWNGEDHRITTDCMPLPGGYWKISVSESVSAEAWKPIAANLMSITIYVANDPKIKLAGSLSQPNARQRMGNLKRP